MGFSPAEAQYGPIVLGLFLGFWIIGMRIGFKMQTYFWDRVSQALDRGETDAVVTDFFAQASQNGNNGQRDSTWFALVQFEAGVHHVESSVIVGHNMLSSNYTFRGEVVQKGSRIPVTYIVGEPSCFLPTAELLAGRPKPWLFCIMALFPLPIVCTVSMLLGASSSASIGTALHALGLTLLVAAVMVLLFSLNGSRSCFKATAAVHPRTTVTPPLEGGGDSLQAPLLRDPLGP